MALGEGGVVMCSLATIWTLILVCTAVVFSLRRHVGHIGRNVFSGYYWRSCPFCWIVKLLG